MGGFVLFGTVFNVITVLIGTAIGVGVRCLTHGKALGGRSKRIFDAIFVGLGLGVLLVGIGGAIKGAVNGQILSAFKEGTVSFESISGERTLAIILSMVFGVIIGELFDLDKQMNKLGDKIQNAMKGRGGNVAQAFVSASLLFCVGSMTIVGAMESGISGDHTLLVTKSIMDLISAVIFTVTMGVGVGFSAVFVLVYQGAITLLAMWLGPFLSNDVITCMGSVGSLLIIALGLNLMGATKIKIMNFVPAMFMPIWIIPILDLFVR